MTSRTNLGEAVWGALSTTLTLLGTREAAKPGANPVALAVMTRPYNSDGNQKFVGS